MATLLVLIGTGTSVGKTYVGERLLRALAARGYPALGYKPIESGVTDLASSDIGRLARWSSFHVKPPLASLMLTAPISPHLAARREGKPIDLERVQGEVRRACARGVRVVLVELPGGAFSPMTDDVCCADFAKTLPGARALLVAADRLGVLHEIGATSRACATSGLPLTGLVLNAPAAEDDSTGHNHEEIQHVTSIPILARLPRLPAEEDLRATDPVWSLAERVLAE